MSNILHDIKDMLGGAVIATDVFDVTIVAAINESIFELSQVGVGPTPAYILSAQGQTWEEYLGDQITEFQAIKSYVYSSTKLIFDPPETSFLLTAMQSRLDRMLWRFNAEPKGGEP